MRDLADWKKEIDRINYTKRELAILHDKAEPTDAELNRLIDKVLDLGDYEYMMKLFRL